MCLCMCMFRERQRQNAKLDFALFKGRTGRREGELLMIVLKLCVLKGCFFKKKYIIPKMHRCSEFTSISAFFKKMFKILQRSHVAV